MLFLVGLTMLSLPNQMRREDCIKDVEKTFNFWHLLDEACKRHLYTINHRWQDDAMRLEEEEALTFCRVSHFDNIFRRDARRDLRNLIDTIDGLSREQYCEWRA